MAQKYPEDEFDRLAAKRKTVGAHRRPHKSRTWLWTLLGVLFVAVLVGLLIGNAMSGDRAPNAEPSATTQVSQEPTDGQAPDAEQPTDGEGAAGSEGADSTPPDAGDGQPDPNTPPEEEPAEEPAAPDKSHQILVLNGRGVAGFAAENQAILEGDGYGNVHVADYRGGAEPAQSTIYYSDDAYAGTAQAAAAVLGVDAVQLDAEVTAAYGAPIVAVMR
ncbi:LytR C-terminal domain-containing protein [Trueperella bialowiezensis]|uniref:LytR/CpsA/Psr regulator C-terminal domain-containing protein n=1 Tax=Trueperella bialowiezensis TaxID=312285 RepID=A0A448PDU4_9ACTO|nr:LytR C-terminal domain-containing protein [Trueperella bialowiezensis]VEI13103.1 Uncharacterised protein [Trueperella bialowiezensis]